MVPPVYGNRPTDVGSREIETHQNVLEDALDTHTGVPTSCPDSSMTRFVEWFVTDQTQMPLTNFPRRRDIWLIYRIEFVLIHILGSTVVIAIQELTFQRLWFIICQMWSGVLVAGW